MPGDETRHGVDLDGLLADLQSRLDRFLVELDEAVPGEEAARYERVGAQARALAAELASARDAGDPADQIGDLVLAALLEAHQPLREQVLYERVRERGAAVSPEEFVALANDLATLGLVRVAVEHDLPSRDPAPFQPRFYRPAS
jgi:hypothetical protein